MWYPGHPVFMRDWNPRSFTIWNGRLFSETHRTISALAQESNIRSRKGECKNRWYVPSFCSCVVSMMIGHFSLANSFEFSCNISIPQLHLLEDFSSHIQIIHCSCSLYRFLTPALFCMPEKIARGVCISLVKEPTHITRITPFASRSCTLEDVATAALLILDVRSILEEHVHQWGSLFGHALWNKSQQLII